MSRKIDALVAEHIMGWTKESTKYDDEYIWTSPDGSVTILPDGIKNYSTNISDAWLVIDKLREQDYHYQIESFTAYVKVTFGFSCGDYASLDDQHYERVDSAPLWHYERVDSAPMAISKAALKAKGVPSE